MVEAWSRTSWVLEDALEGVQGERKLNRDASLDTPTVHSTKQPSTLQASTLTVQWCFSWHLQYAPQCYPRRCKQALCLCGGASLGTCSTHHDAILDAASKHYSCAVVLPSALLHALTHRLEHIPGGGPHGSGGWLYCHDALPRASSSAVPEFACRHAVARLHTRLWWPSLCCAGGLAHLHTCTPCTLAHPPGGLHGAALVALHTCTPCTLAHPPGGLHGAAPVVAFTVLRLRHQAGIQSPCTSSPCTYSPCTHSLAHIPRLQVDGHMCARLFHIRVTPSKHPQTTPHVCSGRALNHHGRARLAHYALHTLSASLLAGGPLVGACCRCVCSHPPHPLPALLHHLHVKAHACSRSVAPSSLTCLLVRAAAVRAQVCP